VITIGIDPHRAPSSPSPRNRAARSAPRSGSRSTATPSPGSAPGPSSGRSGSGRSKAPQVSVAVSRRAWPPPTNRHGCTRPAGSAGPATQHRARPQDRPHRRCRRRDGRSTSPAAAPGAAGGRQPGDIDEYLLPTERRVIRVRQHCAVLLKDVLVTVRFLLLVVATQRLLPPSVLVARRLTSGWSPSCASPCSPSSGGTNAL
jgi:hypothetical protein